MLSASSHHSPQHKQWSPGNAYEQYDSYSYNGSKQQQQTAAFTLKQLLWMRKRSWVQILVISAFTFLVFDSYTKAMATSERLGLFQQQENRMMMHLQRIEQHSILLHESMARLSDVADMVTNPDAKTISQGAPVDSNLIRVQTQQLQEMEEELGHELKALQAKMQSVDRSSIVRTYGEGPVQVTLDLNFPGGSSEPAAITILLWYDTPHAAWTWLQQISRGEWNGAHFGSIKGGALDAMPMIGNAGSLDFVEKSQKGHEAWTVGLADKGNSLGMFINLQDNSASRKRDVCVGKVIDGFESLQRLVDMAKPGNNRRPVTIKKATASHLTAHDRF